MYFSRLRKEDESLTFSALDEFSEEQIDFICFKRGIDIDKQNLKQKKDDLKLWLSISNQRNVPHSLLLYTRINDFCNDIFEISDNEDDQEVLRRSPVDTYYLEKMRVFEETFGIDKLQNSVFKLGEKIKEAQVAREQGEEISYVLDNNDLERMMFVVDEFRTRHSTITESINNTYRIGNKLLDFVEK